MLKKRTKVCVTLLMVISSGSAISDDLTSTVKNVGNGVVGLLNAFGTGKLQPESADLKNGSYLTLSYSGGRFDNPCGLEVFWGDGSREKFKVARDAFKNGFTLEHQYASPQTYQVEVHGKFILDGLGSVVNCPGNYTGVFNIEDTDAATVAKTNQQKESSDESFAIAPKKIVPVKNESVPASSSEKITELERKLIQKQSKRIDELEAQLLLLEKKSDQPSQTTILRESKGSKQPELSTKGFGIGPRGSAMWLRTASEKQIFEYYSTKSEPYLKAKWDEAYKSPTIRGAIGNELERRGLDPFLFLDKQADRAKRAEDRRASERSSKRLDKALKRRQQKKDIETLKSIFD